MDDVFGDRGRDQSTEEHEFGVLFLFTQLNQRSLARYHFGVSVSVSVSVGVGLRGRRCTVRLNSHQRGRTA